MDSSIIAKLNTFIRKYYKNLVVRGTVYSLLLLVVFFVILNVIEYFGWTGTLFRTIVFYSYILLTAIVVCYWIVRPLFKMMRIGKTLTYPQAARIIGNHFSQINDKLLNLLQLQSMADNSNQSSSDVNSELLLAAIEQKTEQLKPIPFQNAIDTKNTKKFSRYLLTVLSAVLIVALAFPKLFSEPSKRYINHTAFYEKPAPFTFELRSATKAVQQSDYEVMVRIKGDMYPDNVNVIIAGQRFEMKKKDKSNFVYTISQIQKTTLIQFEAADFYSKIYTVTVNPKPILTDLTAQISYPAYTKLKSETVNNVTDLSLPVGTKILWRIKTKDCNKVVINNQSTVKEYLTDKSGRLDVGAIYLSDRHISIKTKNDFTVSGDSMTFNIRTIADERPQIAVVEQKDSLTNDNIYFRGQIRDDYGFSKLVFSLKVTHQGDNTAKIYSKRLNITDNENVQEFYHAEYLSQYPDIKQGDKIEYWFEVWDNDQINGSKNTKSQSFNIDVPTEADIERKLESNSQSVSRQSDKTLDKIKQLQQEINELTKKLSQKKELSWQDKKDLQSLQQKQREIQDKIEQINKHIEENSVLEDKYRNIDEELLEKQRQIEELFKQLQNDDLTKLIDQMNNLIEKQLDKDKINESLKNIRQKNEDLSKELDKNLELYKRLDVEKDINETIDKLKELAEKQQKLSEDTKQKTSSVQELEKRQQELNEEFNRLQQKIQRTQEKDKQLQEPFNFKQDKQQEQEIKSEQQQAKDNLQKNNHKKASQNQQKASEKMQKMSERMQQQTDEQQEERLAEDITEVRTILKNLVTLSKKQEDLIYSTQKTAVNDPSYQKIINSQNIIKENMQTIADSLYAMSKRQPQVSKTINEETSDVSYGIEQSIETLLKFNQSVYQSMRNNQAAVSQQKAMTGMNNLALLLAESLNNMNKQQQKGKSGNKSKQCNNPSRNKDGQSAKNMRQLQEALNKEIERLQKELEKRANSPKQKIGEGKELNERLAKAAAQQEMIRQMMQQYLNEMKKEGGKAVGEMNKALKQMEDTQKDIVNKRINKQTLTRQKQILTRMLESEKAEMKKGQEEKRESKVGKDRNDERDKNFEEFKKLKNKEVELFKKIPAEYSPYYKAKIQEYFSNFEN